MTLLLLAVGILLASGFLALVASGSPRTAAVLGAGGAVAAAVVGLVSAVQVLAGGPIQSFHFPWMEVVGGSFHIELDALSAFFVIPILGLTALAAVYGAEYWLTGSGKAPAAGWFYYNLLTASMVLVVVARNAILFLVVWEIMALASYFLVVQDDEKESVREAGWTYLVATHLGTAFLLVLFILLGQPKNSLEFADFAVDRPEGTLSVLFLLALVGFGTKAGIMPFHVWLPEAHPVAPSHVSAVMSGVMIKTGIYGLVRVLTFLPGDPPQWWAWLLIGLGLLSGLLGILFALSQKDLKRLLAYSSVENIGVITLGLGTGMLGLSMDAPALAVLGFAGALLHVLNHALFKGLLFLGAGTILHGTGTANLEKLGGLLRRLPWTGTAFLVGAVAICGLPPLNGFMGEFLIYLGALREETTLHELAAIPAMCVIVGLALIGGLTAACFAKAFGVAFLGHPRSDEAAHVHAPGWLMRGPMLALAAACAVVGVLAPRIVAAMTGPVALLMGNPEPKVAAYLAPAIGSMTGILIAAAVLLGLVAALTAMRLGLLRGREVTAAGTWGCGYTAPTVRMQYSGSSFVQPISELFAPILRTRKKMPVIAGYFPQESQLATTTPEIWREGLYRPAFQAICAATSKLRWLQQGRVQLYVLYIALTLFVLLVYYVGLA